MELKEALVEIYKAAKKKFSDRLVKNDTPIKNTSFGSIRTIQKKEKSLSNFIDTKSLKEIEPIKKQNPDKLVKRLQISFMKKALDKIIENNLIQYPYNNNIDNPNYSHLNYI